MAKRNVATKPQVIPVVERTTIPIKNLVAAKYNPRKISNEALAGLDASISRFGVVQEVVVNKRTGNTIVGGHQRVKALKARGITEVAVAMVDLDEKDEKALNVALNNQHIAGDFTADLQLLLEEIQAADAMLFAELRLDQLLGDPIPLEAQGDPEAIPDVPAVAITKPGDLWLLGEHRLLCGDSTSAVDLARLLNSERVDSLVTDPPYGVDYSAKNADVNTAMGGTFIAHRNIENDVRGDYRAWFTGWLRSIPWSDDATFYVFMSSTEMHNLRLAIEDCGYHWSDYLVWLKSRIVFGRKDYHSQIEHILYGWPVRHKFYGGRDKSSVFEFDKPHRNDLHPTMKPVGLVERIIQDGSASGMVVLDLFGGSGTTLIACEMHQRRARLMEIDPLYCDVIVARFEAYSGKKAKLA